MSTDFSNWRDGKRDNALNILDTLQLSLTKAANDTQQVINAIHSLKQQLAEKVSNIAELRDMVSNLSRRLSSAKEELEKEKEKSCAFPYFALVGDMPSPQEVAQLAEDAKSKLTPINRALLVLGFEQNTIPTKEEVKQAHTRLIKMYHPDVGEFKSSTRVAAVNNARDILMKVV